ncbi:MAG: hypothetical protein ACOYJC_08755 [Christensenellales bacterium]|jgi:hypothetical protein
MALKKCLRCELNYVKDDQKHCDVCQREISGAVVEEMEPCIECGERPAGTIGELCVVCLREKKKRESFQSKLQKDAIQEDDEDITDVDDIGIELDSDIPPNELEEIDNELGIKEESYEELYEEDIAQGDDEEDEYQY